MPTIEQLRFAQRFPFSSAAKRIVKESNVSLDNVSEEVLGRAAIMISHAYSGKDYALEIKSSDLLEQEIIAFPIAKILVSLIKDTMLYRSFAGLFARSTFYYLEKSPEKKQLSLELAQDLSLKFDVLDKKGFFVSIPLEQFLGIKFNDHSLKLVNQPVEKGMVFLNINTFCRFLGEIVFSRISNDLPLNIDSVPQTFKGLARQISQSAKKRLEFEFNVKIEGVANPNAFPPCVAAGYQKLASGEKLPHMARFFLASFLNAIGMPQAQILALFKKSPDFDEKIASYQIKRIAEQNYAPASCEKVKDYGLCPNTECGVKHPLTYYRKKIGKKTKQ